MSSSLATLNLNKVDLDQSIASEKEYRKKLKALQARMTDLSIACFHNQHQVVIVFEGWDAAGKGGSIRRMVEKLDPRSCSVHPIAKPNQQEAREHYLQRFWRRLPQKGHIAVFDRSWYGRVLVERLEEFASKNEWQRAYHEINQFEKALCDDGIVVIKLFLHISQGEQLKRYEARLNDSRKHWKLTEDDIRNRHRAGDYLEAYNEMLRKTHTPDAPWHLIPAEHKWYARIECMEAVVETLERSINTEIPQFSQDKIESARKQLGLGNI